MMSIARLSARADMVDLNTAATLARVEPAQLLRWSEAKRPRVIAFDHDQLGLRFPRWQFDKSVWPLVQRLAEAMDGTPTSMLAWLETPLGVFEGRTPRAALEQGESVERVLDVAKFDGY
jgi:hypothetical protein